MPIKLKLTRTMSSSEATLNEKLDFEVLEDIKLGDEAAINIDYIQVVNGQKMPLRAVKDGTGSGHTAAMKGAIVATSIVFSNLNIKGGEQTIVIEKSGFKIWQPTMTVTAPGTANLEVTLDKIP